MFISFTSDREWEQVYASRKPLAKPTLFPRSILAIFTI